MTGSVGLVNTNSSTKAANNQTRGKKKNAKTCGLDQSTMPVNKKKSTSMGIAMLIIHVTIQGPRPVVLKNRHSFEYMVFSRLSFYQDKGLSIKIRVFLLKSRYFMVSRKTDLASGMTLASDTVRMTRMTKI